MNEVMANIELIDSFPSDFVNTFELFRRVYVYDIDGKIAYIMAVNEGEYGSRSYSMDNNMYYNGQDEPVEPIPFKILDKLNVLALEQLDRDYKEENKND